LPLELVEVLELLELDVALPVGGLSLSVSPHAANIVKGNTPANIIKLFRFFMVPPGWRALWRMRVTDKRAD
jgi:hypothetical protein